MYDCTYVSLQLCILFQIDLIVYKDTNITKFLYLLV